MEDIFSEVRINQCKGGWWIEGFKDGDEEGDLVAAIDGNTARVFYIGRKGKLSPLVQEAIEKKVNEIKKSC